MTGWGLRVTGGALSQAMPKVAGREHWVGPGPVYTTTPTGWGVDVFSH